MASLTFVSPILPDKGEALRRFYQELSGSHRTEYELSRRRLGITRECVRVSQTPQGEFIMVSLEATDLAQMISQVATSDLPFDRQFRQHLQECYGFDVTHTKAAPNPEMIFTWQTS